MATHSSVLAWRIKELAALEMFLGLSLGVFPTLVELHDSIVSSGALS